MKDLRNKSIIVLSESLLMLSYLALTTFNYSKLWKQLPSGPTRQLHQDTQIPPPNWKIGINNFNSTIADRFYIKADMTKLLVQPNNLSLALKKKCLEILMVKK